MENTIFYMVFVEGEKTPAYKHYNELIALKEAKRLAEKTDKTAYVLKSIKAVEIAKFNIMEMIELPF